MVINKYKMVGSAFLAFGLLGNVAYGSGNENSDGVHADSSQRSLWEDLRSALELAEDLDGYIEVARCMRKGIDFTLRSRNGETLLFFSSCPATVLMLVSHGELDLDAQDEEENTALHLFVRVFLECLLDTLGAGREEIEVLLGAGANPLVRNGDDETVLQIVRRWIDEEEALPMEARNSNSKAAIRKAKALAQRLERAEGEWRKAHRDDA
ncbi:MAG: hypothetical protein LBH08_02955 [Puniceicoccales bacterium]|jgi:hypothetical protein|nr:hypothetical protein [Puniceicoccales bacterium]